MTREAVQCCRCGWSAYRLFFAGWGCGWGFCNRCNYGQMAPRAIAK